jgi:hypothetical protein
VLTDLTQLERDFSTSEQGEHDGLIWLRLKSKDKEPQFAYADLGFDADGLAACSSKDTLGDKTEISFSGWSKNPPLPADQFRFHAGRPGRRRRSAIQTAAADAEASRVKGLAASITHRSRRKLSANCRRSPSVDASSARGSPGAAPAGPDRITRVPWRVRRLII